MISNDTNQRSLEKRFCLTISNFRHGNLRQRKGALLCVRLPQGAASRRRCQLSLPGKFKTSGTEAPPGGTLGPRCSLARLLDVLGPRGRMLVHGGVGLLVGHLGGCWGEVFVAPGDDTGDEHSWLRRTGAFPFLVVLVLLFFGISRMRVFLHNSHPTSFHGGRVSGSRLQLPLGR